MRERDDDVELSRGWRLWPEVEVRAAGFSVACAEELASPALANAVDAALAAEQRLDEARAPLIEDLRARGDADGRKARRRLFKGSLAPADAAPLGDAGAAWARRAREVDDERASLKAAWRRARRASAAALRVRLEDDAFRRALLWQNPSALRGALAALARADDDDDRSAPRKARELATSYLQRYATKNDTVGFFGPVGWGRWGGGAGVDQRPGAALIASSSVQLEPWAVAAVFDALVRGDEALARLLPVEPPARLRLAEGVAFGAPGARSSWARRTLDDEEYALLALADGATPLVEQATRVAEATGRTTADVLRTADRLVSSGLLVRELPVTISTAPEARGLALLERLAARDDGAPARAALAAWAALARAVDEVRASADDASRLAPAVEGVERSFEQRAGVSPERKPGEMYACRTTLLLNCRRDHDVTLGDDVLARVRRPLSIVLDACRWFTFRAADRFQQLVAAELERRAHGRERVPLAELYTALVPRFRDGGRAAFLDEVSREAADRWHETLLPPDDVAEVHVPLDDAEARAEERLRAPHPGWPSARHHSPDLLLARRGEEHVPILGEVHPGVNTLAILQAVSQHPAPERLRARFERDLPPLVVEGQHDSYALCAQDHLLSARDVRLHSGSRFAASPGGEVLRLGDCDLWRDGDELVVEHLPSGRRWPALVALERIVRLNATTELHLHTRGARRPRVWLGDMIVQRAAWRLPAEDVAPLLDARGADRVLAARRLRARHDLPELVFARAAHEKKPMFVDFRSPRSLDVLARFSRRAPSLTVSEMLPSLDETWLADAAGRRYVAELRMVATDPRPWEPIPLHDP